MWDTKCISERQSHAARTPDWLPIRAVGSCVGGKVALLLSLHHACQGAEAGAATQISESLTSSHGASRAAAVPAGGAAAAAAAAHWQAMTPGPSPANSESN